MEFLGYKIVLLIFGAGASVAVWTYAAGMILDVIEKVQSSHPFQRRVKAKEASARTQGSKYTAEQISAALKGMATTYRGNGEEDSALIVRTVILDLADKYPEFQ